MNNRISLEELVAVNNTPKAKALIISYGYEPARDMQDLVEKLHRVKREYREEALEQIANLHPHKDLILHFNQPKEVKSNACGCGNSNCNGGGKYSNFELSDDYIDFIGSKSGANNNGSSKDKLMEYMPMIAVAGIFALAITAIGKKS